MGNESHTKQQQIPGGWKLSSVLRYTGARTLPQMQLVAERLDGARLPPVDIIYGGSPCQDLSVAGARASLAGERSGLFMEQIRIVKEMRNAEKRRGRTDVAVRPRFCVWENVPGAFS